MDPVIDRPPLNAKWVLPNSTIVLSMGLYNMRQLITSPTRVTLTTSTLIDVFVY